MARMSWLENENISTAKNKKAADKTAFFIRPRLQGGLNFESPGFQQGLRDILGVLVTPSPFAQTRRTEILVRGQLEFLHRLLERRYHGDHRPNRLRLAPVWISASSCHSIRPAFSESMKNACQIA